MMLGFSFLYQGSSWCYRLPVALAACFLGGLAAAGGRAESPSQEAKSQEVVQLGSRRQLFLDGRLIERLEGATLRLREPRRANTILKIDKSWEGYHNFGIGVFHHDGTYYLYYRAMPGETFGKHYAAVALSNDGIHWTKPEIGLVEVNGTKDNNLVALEDENGRLQPNQMSLDFWLDRRPAVPDSERFKLVTYQTNGGPHNPGPTSGEDAVHTATFWASGDGLRFRKLDPQPEFSSRLKNSFDSFNVYFWSEAEQQYVSYYRWYDSVRTIARTTSKDLMTWTEPAPMAYGDTPRENLYTNQTTPYFRAPDIYIAMPTRFMEGRRGIMTDEQFRQLEIAEFYRERAETFNGHPADGTLMVTRPGSTQYDRTFMESFVRPGVGRENWVGRGNYPIRGVFQTGPAEMSFYVNRHYQQASWHIERMTLRLDGFASLHAPYEGGEMVTKPLTFSGQQLTINYSTSVAGDIRIEMQDAEGEAIPGFALKDADYVIGDEISRVVTWGGKSDLQSLAGKVMRLRFILKDADVYAIEFADQAGVQAEPRRDSAGR